MRLRRAAEIRAASFALDAAASGGAIGSMKLLNKAGQATGVATTMALVADQASMGGDYLYVVGTSGSSQQLSSIADSSSNAYGLLHGQNVGSSQYRTRVFGSASAAALAAGQTVTCTFIGANGIKLAFAFAVSGVSSEDAAAQANTSALLSTAVSLTTPPLAQASNKVVAHLAVPGGNADGAPTVSAPFVLVASHIQQSLAAYVYAVDTSSTSPVAFSATLPVARDWSLTLTTLKGV